MCLQVVVGFFDLDDDSVMQQLIQKCGCDYGIFEDFVLFGKVVIGGQDYGIFFIVGIDELEEQVGFVCGDGQVVDFVDDQQGGLGIEVDFFGEMFFLFGFG